MTLIPTYEEFSDSRGRFLNYDGFDKAQLTQIGKQTHVDIRNFVNSDLTKQLTLSDLDVQTMTQLDAQTMSQLESTKVLVPGENWSAGTVGSQADRNHWNGLSLSCAIGTNTTQSVMTSQPIDISTGFTDSDFLSVALPAFPLASINTAQSYLDLTSDSGGSFATSASIAFNSSLVALVAGDSELRVNRSALNGINLASITGVRFRIQATAACTFRVLAVRLLGQNWVYAPLDIDTRSGRLVLPVTLNGSAAHASAFPTATAPVTPTDWPILFHADAQSGSGDPRPVNVTQCVVFNTGSKTGANRFTLYFREMPLAYTTMANLDGIQTMGNLESLPGQPDYGIAKYAVRTVGALDGQTMANLDGTPMSSLQLQDNYVNAAWISVNVAWGAADSITIADTVGTSYSPTGLTLAANTSYALVVTLQDDGIQAVIYPVDAYNAINWGSPTFDTTRIVDDGFMVRRPGRVGWYAQLTDGDARIEFIRNRYVHFGEYRSHPFESITPLVGATLYADSTPPRELVSTLGSGPYGGNITVQADGSYKLFNDGTQNRQGAQTNTFYIEDWERLLISFDMYFPGIALNAGNGFDAYLLGELDTRVYLNLPPILPDRWQTMKTKPYAGYTAQTGLYQLVLLQTLPRIANTWYLNNVSIKEEVVEWSARGAKADAWKDHNPVFINFDDAINSDTAGVYFPERGSALQISAKVHKQDGVISKMQAKPRYAELGQVIVPSGYTINVPPPNYGQTQLDFTWNPTLPNFSWSDGVNTYTTTNPKTAINTAITFTPTVTYPPGSGLSAVLYEWDFGDGSTSTAASPTHTFKVANGSLRVRLCVTDNKGHKVCVGHYVYPT